MELRSFISKALCDITGGICDAQEAAVDGVEIVPITRSSYQSVDRKISDLQGVEFDVCIRVDEGKGREAKLGVINAFIGAGIGETRSTETGHAATLKFSVPIRLPNHGKRPPENNG